MEIIYMIGGAPRTGKSILGQRFAARFNIGWISTDILMELLRVKGDDGVKTEWDATPEAISSNAEWFLPYLERFVWGISSRVKSYLIEGVDFLPTQVAQLATEYQIRSIFLGCSKMYLNRLDKFPGFSPGYAGLRGDERQQIVHDIPIWSDFICQQAKQYGYPFIDMIGDFPSRLNEAEAALEVGEELD